MTTVCLFFKYSLTAAML